MIGLLGILFGFWQASKAVSSFNNTEDLKSANESLKQANEHARQQLAELESLNERFETEMATAQSEAMDKFQAFCAMSLQEKTEYLRDLAQTEAEKGNDVSEILAALTATDEVMPELHRREERDNNYRNLQLSLPNEVREEIMEAVRFGGFEKMLEGLDAKYHSIARYLKELHLEKLRERCIGIENIPSRC